LALGSTAIETGPIAVAKGEPSMAVSAPVKGLIVYPETVEFPEFTI
jgi:hypothetical protein